MASSIHCVVVTPEDTTLDEKADFVVVPLIDGEAGIGDNHAPMIGRLGCGEVRVKSGDKSQRFYVDGGFVQVDHNQVSVITGKAVAASQIDAAAVELELNKAQSSQPETDEEKLARARTITQSKAMLKVAAKK